MSRSNEGYQLAHKPSHKKAIDNLNKDHNNSRTLGTIMSNINDEKT